MTDFIYEIAPFLQLVYKFVIHIIPLIIAIILHEVSHGAAAYMLGDDTAKRANRLNLYNHFDFWGSFVIPVGLYLANSPVMIGYAKPVPIDPRNFKHPLNDMAVVAIAGPACNFVLACIAALFFPRDAVSLTTVNQILINFTAINLGLFFFNLIPIPPLDGSRILAAMLPIRWVPAFYRFEPFGILIVVGLEMLSKNILPLFGVNESMFSLLVGKPAMATLKLFLS